MNPCHGDELWEALFCIPPNLVPPTSAGNAGCLEPQCAPSIGRVLDPLSLKYFSVVAREQSVNRAAPCGAHFATGAHLDCPLRGARGVARPVVTAQW